MYQSISGLSGPVYQLVSYVEQNSGGYDIEYICESMPWVETTEYKWRVQRTRYLSWQNIIVDRYFAVNNLPWNEEMSSFNKGTAEFIFAIPSQESVMDLHFGPSI